MIKALEGAKPFSLVDAQQHSNKSKAESFSEIFTEVHKS